MAVAVLEAATDVDLVAVAAVRVYASRGEHAVDMPLVEFLADAGPAGSIRTIVSETARTIELIVDAEVDPAMLAPAAWRLDGRGWRIVVLVALDRIGAAHAGLRGAPCRLQPWWFDGDAVVFGGFETP